MNKKHYKLVAGLLAMMLAYFPISVNAKTHYAPSKGRSIHHIETSETLSPISEGAVPKILKDLYEVPTDQLAWWTTQIVLASKKHNVPIAVLLPMYAVESKFNTKVKSEPGTVGPSQIVSKVWRKRLMRERKYNINDPAQNVLAGAYILSKYKLKCKSWDNALRCYNVGDGAFKRHEHMAEQRRYMKRINVQRKRIQTFNSRLV